MWQVGFKLYADDSDKISKIQQIQVYFDQIFSDLENKPLPSQPAPSYGGGMEQHAPAQHTNKSSQQVNKKLEKIQKELQ